MKTSMLKIDPEKLRAFSKQEGKSLAQMSYEIGRSASYLSYCMNAGEIPEGQYRVLCKILNVSPDRFIPDPPPKQEPPKQKMVNQLDVPFSVDLKIFPDRVRFTILFDGKPLYSTFSYLKGKTETDLMQAISYAAHMVYKMAEQKKLQEGVKDA